MFELQVNPELDFSPSEKQIGQLIQAAFKYLEHSEENDIVGIHFTTDEEIQALNAQYRGFDKPTDVLSFEAHEFDPETGATYLGDLILSVPTLKRQAASAKHPVETEMLLLITHGILHLLGYDHATPEEKEEMWSIQSEILAQIEVFPRQLPED